MAQKVQFSDYVRPICLLLNVQMENVLRFNVTGWGMLENGQMSNILQKTTLSKVYPSYCMTKYEKTVDQYQICTGSETSDTCVGDSGGPLTAEINYNGEVRTVQYGIVSYGSQICAKGGLSVNTNVANYMDWIMRALIKNRAD
nr:serine protease grass-like [Drosophila takahashii]